MNTYISEQRQIIEKQKEIVQKKINDKEEDIFLSSLSSTFDIESRIKKDFNIKVASNQLDDIEAICDLGIKDVATTAARAGGKTFGATIGISLLSLDMVIPIGLTAPTAGQANRIIKVFNTEVVPKSPYLKSQINWKECTNTRVAFKNGSTWESFSGSYEAGGESRHFALLLCFPKGTKIKMQDGSEKNIEDVTEGDVVISYDITSKQLVSKTVLGKIENEADELIEIEYEAEGVKKVVRCTPSHRIFTERGEVQAKDLREDDEIYYIANERLMGGNTDMIKKGKILSIKRIKVEKQKVYDLTIKDNHNYFANGLLVHNCDEAQDISDLSMSQMILPMIGHSSIRKVIKIGVPRSKNHFYRSAMSKSGIYLAHDWLHCPNLMNGGIFEFEGFKYPESVLSRMPYVKWQQYFPNNPELWRDGDMSVDDFETQYEMKWLLDSDLFLNENEQSLLLGDFVFSHPETEEYFFGLDLAGGAKIKKGTKRDYTALSIGRKRNGVVQFVDAYEFQGDALEQMDNIIEIIHPMYGKYHCKFGLSDYGYNPMMVDALGKAGVNIEGVQFGARDQNTGKNNKNAMFETFKFELQTGRVKYPSKEFIMKHKILRKHFEQWCVLEEKKGIGINSRIDAPESENYHDDGVCSNILLLKSCLTAPTKQFSKKKEYKFPQLLQGISVMTGVDEHLKKQVDGDSPLKRNNNPFGNGPSSL